MLKPIALINPAYISKFYNILFINPASISIDANHYFLYSKVYLHEELV